MKGSKVIVKLPNGRKLHAIIKDVYETSSGTRIRALSGDLLLNDISIKDVINLMK